MISYYFREGMGNIGRNKLLSFTTIFTISVSMMIFGIFLILFMNLNLLHQRWGERVQITIFLKEGTDEKALMEIIGKDKAVQDMVYTSKEKALMDFGKELGDEKSLLNSIKDNPLPASLDISLKKQYRSSEFINPLVQLLRGLQGVEEVHYGEEWVKNLTALLEGLKITGLFFGSLLALGIIFIISNTIRLTLYARQEEIEIMRLIGATNGFIRGPFLMEGALQGAGGGALALLFLYMFYRIVAYWVDLRLPGFHPDFLDSSLFIQLPVSGLILGLLGSFFSIRRYLRI